MMMCSAIDSAPFMIPNDLDETSLIVETYEYKDFLKVPDNKLRSAKDNKQNRRRFKRYTRDKFSLIKKPRYKIVYVDKEHYDSLNVREYRYVLKTTNRIDYDPNNIIVANDGFVYPFISTRLYYVYDRETHAVYKEINDLSVLSRN
jgi:hypothetical protein